MKLDFLNKKKLIKTEKIIFIILHHFKIKFIFILKFSFY